MPRAVDTAAKEGVGHDYSAIATWASDGISYYLLDVWAGQVEFADLRDMVAQKLVIRGRSHQSIEHVERILRSGVAPVVTGVFPAWSVGGIGLAIIGTVALAGAGPPPDPPAGRKRLDAADHTGVSPLA